MKFQYNVQKFKTLSDKLSYLDQPLTDRETEEKYLCENSLDFFVQTFWNVVCPDPLIHDDYMTVICEHFEAVYHKFITNLLINQPPRTAKSLIGCVFFNAWCFVQNPTIWLSYNAYTPKLTKRDSQLCKLLIKNPKYQKYWGDRVQIHSMFDNVFRYQLTRGGGRLSTSVGGMNTGEGASIRVVDDPNNVLHAESEAEQLKTNEWFSGVLATREKKIGESSTIVIQQRCGFRDLSAYILNHPDFHKYWTHLCLSMEFEPERRCTTIPLPLTDFKKPWSDPRKHAGDILCPKMLNREQLEALKSKMWNNKFRISCQFQQNPLLEEGALIRPDWFQFWKQPHMPYYTYVIQSWDTALTTTVESCFSACSTWGVFLDGYRQPNIMLISLFTGQIPYPELRKMAIRLSENYYDTNIDRPVRYHISKKPDHILIERKVSGFCLHDDLARSGISAIAFEPNKYGKKEVRCANVTDLIEAGRVWLPCVPIDDHPLTDFSQQFMAAAVNFPGARAGCDYNDIVDSMSQAFIKLKEMGLVELPTHL